MIAAGDPATGRLNQLANHFEGREDGFRFRVEPHRLTAPLLYPSHLLAAAANYRSHAAEMDVEQEVDPDRDAPYLFAKSPRSGIIGPGEAYRIPTRPRPHRLGGRTRSGHREDRPTGSAR